MAATTTKAGMMKRRQSGRRRGAGVMSGIGRPLAHDFVKCKRTGGTTKDAEIASLLAIVLVAVFCLDAFSLREPVSTSLENAVANVHHYPPRNGILDRRPLGVRLRLADVASGLRIRRAGRSAADRRTSRTLRLFLRPSRHAGKTRAGAR